jgi:starvation-inducible outer membrane lipoprotein
LIGLGFVSFLLAGCASAPPVAERYVPPPVGATVEYRMANTGSFGASSGTVTIKVSEALWEGRMLRKYETPSGATLQSPSAGVVVVFDPSGRPMMRYDPPLDFNFPLVVGKSWTTDHELTVGAGTKMPMKTTWKVEAYEDITVPAGTFKAWRVVMTDNFGFRQTNWSMPDTLGMYAKRISERGQGHPQGVGTQVLEMSRVPAVR